MIGRLYLVNKGRPVLDCHDLNQVHKDQKFKYTTWPKTIKAVKNAKYLAKLDLELGYF